MHIIIKAPLFSSSSDHYLSSRQALLWLVRTPENSTLMATYGWKENKNLKWMSMFGRTLFSTSATQMSSVKNILMGGALNKKMITLFCTTGKIYSHCYSVASVLCSLGP